MAILLRHSTASQVVLLGAFLDAGDGDTPETGLTIAASDIRIWKAGATDEVAKNSGGATHVASGRYRTTLDADDTDTVGSMEINVHVAGALAVRRECLVLPADVYDRIVTGSQQWTDWTATEREQIRYRLGIEGDASAPVDDEVKPALARDVLVVGMGEVLADEDTPEDAVAVVLNSIAVGVAGISAGAVAAEVWDSAQGLAVYDAALAAGAVANKLDTMLVEIGETDEYQFTVDALENGPSGEGGGSDWTSGERAAIRSILGFSSGGDVVDPTTGILDAIRDVAVAIEEDSQDIQTRLPASLVSGRIDASVGAMAANVMTAAAAASDLTTELQSGLATASALAAVDGKIDTIQAKTDNLPSDPADQSLIIAAADSLASAIGVVDSVVDAIKAKTDSLTFTKAGHVDANAQRINDVEILGDGAGEPFHV